MKNWKLALLAIAISLGLAFHARAEVPVRKFVTNHELYADKEKLPLCFVSAGGIKVRVFEGACPKKEEFEKNTAGLLSRLGAKRDLFKGFTTVYTKHALMGLLGGSRYIWADGTSNFGKSTSGAAVRFIVLTSHESKNCDVSSTQIHELGHMAFVKIGLSSAWLDEDDDTPCTYDDAHPLRKVVMTPGEEAPQWDDPQKVRSVQVSLGFGPALEWVAASI